MNGLDLNDVAVFTAVVRNRSFAAAGRELGLPGSAISRRIARLEAQLGQQLLRRTTRRVGLTEAGQRLYDHTASLQRMIRDGVQAVADSRAVPAGTVRVTAPPDDGGVIWGLLSGFLRDHPAIDLELTHTLERVDLVAEGIDIALRGGDPPETDRFAAHRLIDSRMVLVASPGYLARRGVPARAEDLDEHDGICMDPWAPNAIRRVHGDRGSARVRMRSRLRANSLATAQRAALDGLGIAPLLELTCSDALRSGALVEVLRGALPDQATMWAITPLRRDRSAAASAMLDALIARAQALSGGSLRTTSPG
jgi:DNA-binding transcriptional LysR family regulator